MKTSSHTTKISAFSLEEERLEDVVDLVLFVQKRLNHRLERAHLSLGCKYNNCSTIIKNKK